MPSYEPHSPSLHDALPISTAAGTKRVLDDALRIAPGLAEATVLETRVGVRPMATREGALPYAGAVPGADGLWLEALPRRARSEEHTSELQSRFDFVCCLLH